jgi:ubiquinone/menaquinone biosynthesis C-methylase UbiE
MTKTSFDSFAINYDKHMSNAGDITHRKVIDPSLFKAAGEIKNKVIYDIGCGNGYIARKMVKAGAREVWASDISPQLIKIAKTKYPKVGIKYLIQKGDSFKNIPTNYFNLIKMNMVIHYIKDLNTLFKGVSSALKKGGRFAFTGDHPLGKVSYLHLGKVNLKETINLYKDYTKEKMKIVKNHWTGKKDLLLYKRPLGKYINLLSRNNLLVDTLIEPKTIIAQSRVHKKQQSSPIPFKFSIGARKVK